MSDFIQQNVKFNHFRFATAFKTFKLYWAVSLKSNEKNFYVFVHSSYTTKMEKNKLRPKTLFYMQFQMFK